MLDKEQKHLDNVLGHVIGMHQLRQFLSGTAGDVVLQFWLDIQYFKEVCWRHADKEAEELWRDLQLKYFTTEGLVALKDNKMWAVLSGKNLYQ